MGKVVIGRGELKYQDPFLAMGSQPEADLRTEDSILSQIQPLDYYIGLDIIMTKVRMSLLLTVTPIVFYYPKMSGKATPTRVFVQGQRILTHRKTIKRQ